MDAHRAIERSLAMAHGLAMPLPVVFGGRAIAQVGWDRKTDAVWAAPFTSYDDIIDKITRATPQTYSIYIRKNTPSAALTADSWYDMWSIAGGEPGAGGTYPGAAATAYVHSPATDAGIPSLGPPLTGSQTRNIIAVDATAQVSFAAGVGPFTVILYDRVLVYNACAIVNALTNMTNTVPATRYDGVGVQIMVTSQTVLGGAVNLTALSYNDSNGASSSVGGLNRALDAGATATVTVPALVCSGAPRTTPWLSLADGDIGAQRINSWTCSAAQTGAISFVLAKPLYTMTINGTRQSFSRDLVRSPANMAPLADDACLGIIMQNSGVQAHIGFNVTMARG